MLREEFFRRCAQYKGGELEFNDVKDNSILKGPITELKIVHEDVYVHTEWLAVRKQGVWRVVDRPTPFLPIGTIVDRGAHRLRATVAGVGVFTFFPNTEARQLAAADVHGLRHSFSMPFTLTVIK